MTRIVYTRASSIRIEILYMLLLLLIGLDDRVIWAITFIFTLFALVEWRRYNFRFKHVGADGVSTHGSDDWRSIKVVQRTPLLVEVAEGLVMVSLARNSDCNLFDLGWWWVRVVKPVCITMLVVYFSSLYSPFKRWECWWKWLLLRYIDFAL